MRILRYVSDIHLELRKTIYHPKLASYWNFKKSKNDKYYLALLGDIGNPFFNQKNLNDFLSNVAPHYENILYVPGNHEYYNSLSDNQRSCEEHIIELQNMCKKYPNVQLLNNQSIIIDDIQFIGSTLWSQIFPENKLYIESVINDYNLILDNEKNKITTELTNRWNMESIKFIETELNLNSDKKKIILTHHAPLFSSVLLNQYTANPKYITSQNNQAFHNDLMHLFQTKPNNISAWLYGHTHWASVFKLNDTIIATNQLGYSREEHDINFNEYAFIDLDKLSVINPNKLSIRNDSKCTQEEFNEL
jgi:predicted phosphodiesterase